MRQGAHVACTYIDKPTKLCRNGTSERVVVHEEIRTGRQRKVADFSWEGTGEIIVGKHELVRETSELDRKNGKTQVWDRRSVFKG